MKYLVLIPDGMADEQVASLGNKSPMEAANKPIMDRLAARSLYGLVQNVPEGMVPESDTANMAILSFDPKVYSKGRSPLEAVSMGLTLEGDDVAIRANTVSLSDAENYEDRIMLDNAADEITTEEAAILIDAVNSELSDDFKKLYVGVSYRHCLVWKGANDKYDFTRPHDIIGKFGSANVLLKRASQGTGVIAGGPARAILELAGIKNIRTKSLGSNNKQNVVLATLAGLQSLQTPEEVAKKRGKSVDEILG